MELKPSEPPGHARRKLRAVVAEIERLRAEGYTIRAIQQALDAAGVKVGWSTVQREAARLTAAREAVPARAQRKPPPPASPGTPAPPPASKAVKPAADVEGFFEQHVTNPLFRKKGKL